MRMHSVPTYLATVNCVIALTCVVTVIMGMVWTPVLLLGAATMVTGVTVFLGRRFMVDDANAQHERS